MARVYPGVRCWRGGGLQVTHRQQAEPEDQYRRCIQEEGEQALAARWTLLN